MYLQIWNFRKYAQSESIPSETFWKSSILWPPGTSPAQMLIANLTPAK